ncbi:MAG TPA: hypothetical protein VH877_11565 [Polyangia bacterium]|jgi:hypothetical protein|nr:hypothetical protein [Polyangia bacterium]
MKRILIALLFGYGTTALANPPESKPQPPTEEPPKAGEKPDPKKEKKETKGKEPPKGYKL